MKTLTRKEKEQKTIFNIESTRIMKTFEGLIIKEMDWQAREKLSTVANWKREKISKC